MGLRVCRVSGLGLPAFLGLMEFMGFAGLILGL